MDNTPMAWKKSVAQSVSKLIENVMILYYYEIEKKNISLSLTDKSDGKWNVYDITISRNGSQSKPDDIMLDILRKKVLERFGEILEAVGLGGIEETQRKIWDALREDSSKDKDDPKPEIHECQQCRVILLSEDQFCKKCQSMDVSA